MDNRRRALLGGGDKGLYIYKAGFTDWQNVAEVTTSTGTSLPTITFGTNSVVITASSKNTGSKVTLLIEETTYKKYTKLIVKMNVSATNPSSTRLIWTNNLTPGAPADETEFRGSGGTNEYSFDITGDTGNRYLQFYPYIKNAVYTVYDVHFE